MSGFLNLRFQPELGCQSKLSYLNLHNVHFRMLQQYFVQISPQFYLLYQGLHFAREERLGIPLILPQSMSEDLENRQSL